MFQVSIRVCVSKQKVVVENSYDPNPWVDVSTIKKIQSGV